MEGDRWIALEPGRDIFCEGGRTDRLGGVGWRAKRVFPTSG